MLETGELPLPGAQLGTGGGVDGQPLLPLPSSTDGSCSVELNDGQLRPSEAVAVCVCQQCRRARTIRVGCLPYLPGLMVHVGGRECVSPLVSRRLGIPMLPPS